MASNEIHDDSVCLFNAIVLPRHAWPQWDGWYLVSPMLKPHEIDAIFCFVLDCSCFYELPILV